MGQVESEKLLEKTYPSMFTVAPNGMTKFATPSGICPVPFAQARETGIDAAELEVANATEYAGIICLQNLTGFLRVKPKYSDW